MLSGLIGSRESVIAFQNTALTNASNELQEANKRIKKLEIELEKSKENLLVEKEKRKNLEIRFEEKLVDSEKLWNRLEAVKRALG